MHSLEMHWSVGADKQKICGSNRRPGLSDIIALLPSMLSSTGNITMHVNDADPLGPQLLEMEIERGQILFSLLQGAEKDSYVRFYRRPRKEHHTPNIVKIRGIQWTSGIVCTEPSIALAIFKEFFDKGDVSRKILN